MSSASDADLKLDGASAGAKRPFSGVDDHDADERKTKKARKPIRVWCDGCFDMFHFGHANALRQAKMLGDILVVGVHSDADILRHKGPPVVNEKDRYLSVRACKWVDEVVEAAPYVTTLETLDKYNIDFCVHGEDITTDENGVDTYQLVKSAGRYKTIKRTVGVSTTDLVGRMLLLTKDHLNPHLGAESKGKSGPVSITAEVHGLPAPTTNGSAAASSASSSSSSAPVDLDSFSVTGAKHTHADFFASSRTISQFAAGNRPPRPDDVVVYIDGAFDLFHVGHIRALQLAKSFGTYLIVGIHEDGVVNRAKGANFPIMNVHERVLSVLQCKYVDEVITGAPWKVDEHLIDTFNVSVVAHGSTSDYPDELADPYRVPRERGILKVFTSEYPITTHTIIEQVLSHRAKYEQRNRLKQKSEQAYSTSGSAAAAAAKHALLHSDDHANGTSSSANGASS